MKLPLRLLLLVMVLTGTCTQAIAQKKLDQQMVTDLQKTTKYAFVLTTERHFKGVLGMYDKLLENGVPITDYEIVVKGPVVAQLLKGSELEGIFETYRNRVKVSVCSVAMEKLGVQAEQLFSGLEVTPTASLRMLQLQANGYNTLTY